MEQCVVYFLYYCCLRMCVSLLHDVFLRCFYCLPDLSSLRCQTDIWSFWRIKSMFEYWFVGFGRNDSPDKSAGLSVLMNVTLRICQDRISLIAELIPLMHLQCAMYFLLDLFTEWKKQYLCRLDVCGHSKCPYMYQNFFMRESCSPTYSWTLIRIQAFSISA